MPLKSYLIPYVTQHRFSQTRLDKSRRKFETARIKSNTGHIVEFFHDPSDPYSQLLAQTLPKFQSRYDVKLVTHLVRPPDSQAAPERPKLSAYAKLDAARLANKAKIDFTIQDHSPAQDTAIGDMRRKDLGHYNGAMIYYGGEWYWGLDRLHYLEARLRQLGLHRSNPDHNYIYEPPSVPVGSGNTKAQLHWYFSFRSPYTAIVPDRVKALCDAYGAELILRPILPMVMRGLPVPKAKKTYIPLDTAREARRLNIDYGKISDPVGKPVEMGYSLLAWAKSQDKGFEYVQNWLAAVWSEGINAGTHKGLRKIIERSELSWTEAKTILGNEDWRKDVEANQSEMMEYGIWGVPSFRINKTITWGQDRLWVMEDVLQSLSE